MELAQKFESFHLCMGVLLLDELFLSFFFVSILYWAYFLVSVDLLGLVRFRSRGLSQLM